MISDHSAMPVLFDKIYLQHKRFDTKITTLARPYIIKDVIANFAVRL